MFSFADLDWMLFLLALISSTLFPGGSEAYLLYRLQETQSNAFALVAIASIGNILGSVITYYMGRLAQHLGHDAIERRFRISAAHISQAEAHFQRYGLFALLFAWLPIIGDPLCLVAGLLRYSIVYFILIVSLGKIARYAILAWAFF